MLSGCDPCKPFAVPVPVEEANSIGALIDSLPLGRFHVLHVLRQIFLNVNIAIVIEITPYVLQGLDADFHTSKASQTLYSALFTGGAVLGAFLVSLQDEFGRVIIIRWGSFFALLCTVFSMLMPSFALVAAWRVPLGIAFASMQYGAGAWFAEFLPTRQRGPLYVCLNLGYPIGRGIAIVTAWNVTGHPWRWMLFLTAVGLAFIFLTALTLPESARSLAARGDQPRAYAVMRDVYACNRTPFPESAERVIYFSKPAGKGRTESSLLVGSEGKSFKDVWKRLVTRWLSLRLTQPRLLIFALILFLGISLQQSLILNWGPSVFQKLLYPNEPTGQLPYGVLFGWNFADFLGLTTSIFLIDRLGRRFFFVVGFLAAAVLWSFLASYRSISFAIDPSSNPFAGLIAIGALAQATRAFVPEGGNLWALESFPTSQRGTLYAAVNVVYQLAATIVVPISSVAQDASYETILLFYAALHFILGTFTCFLPKETSGVTLDDS
ncbi:MAG: hypothetical protein SGPRY_008856 [Prymnesium sp.]